MIQPTLFFVLGFLCAGFIALLVAPAVLRRAVNLTRKRVEGSLPLTLDEIQADKDSIRAEAAVAIRRLEMSGEAARDRSARQMIEIDRRREEIRSLTEDRDGKGTAIAGLEARLQAMTDSLQQRGEEVQKLSARQAQLEGEKAELEKELAQLGHLYEEASFASSSRQIQLVARESEIETLSSEILHVKAQRKDADARAQDMALETRKARETLKVEKKRADDLDRKLARLMSTLADREEKLERLERNSSRPETSGGRPSVAGQAAAAMLGGEAGLQPDPDEAAAAGGEAGQELAMLAADRKRLEQRLTALARENRKLKAQNALGSKQDAGHNALLREQMSELAAEVVNLTARLEGPGSPIATVLGRADEKQSEAPSLADRIRALQRASAQSEAAPAPEK